MGAGMISGKYAADYRLENELNPRNGKLRTVTVYRGPLFSFVRSEAIIKKMRLLYPLLTGLSVLIYAGLLFTNTAAGHTFYVMLPIAPLCFPLLYAMAGCWRLLTAKAQVTREHRDKTQNRLAATSACMMGFSGASVIGHIVYWCLNGEKKEDLLLLFGAAVIFVCGLVMFLNRKNLEMTQTGTTVKEE